MLLNFLPSEYLVFGIFLFFFVWAFILTFFLIRAIRHYNLLTKKTKKRELMKILENIFADISKNKKNIAELNEETQKIKKDDLKHIQKVGLLRYNPFSDTGGDQSFVLSFLDEENNGVVLSSLHGRDSTRVYAKTVKKGKGEPFALSKEEEEVIKRSKKGRHK